MRKPRLGDVRRGQHMPPKPGIPKFREERLPAEIRTLHPAGFRSGEWARVCAVAPMRGRACWHVQFPDGTYDEWVVDDPDGHYEFR